MESKFWKIYWNDYLFGTYLHGSKITFHKKDDIEFENELMPPGTVIKEWYSKVKLQMIFFQKRLRYVVKPIIVY